MSTHGFFSAKFYCIFMRNYITLPKKTRFYVIWICYWHAFMTNFVLNKLYSVAYVLLEAIPWHDSIYLQLTYMHKIVKY